MGDYTHLHLHTEYSLLDGANKIKELAKRLKKEGIKSCAITDHGNMFGAIDFYKTMTKEGIKPIIGIEAYIHNGDELGDKSIKQRFHVCLFAKNEIGYKNLMYLSSMSYIEGFYYYPRINKRILREHSEGLICSSACLQGEVSWHLNTKNERNVQFGAKGYERAKEIAIEYRDIFGEDFYLELMRHGINDQLFIDEQIIRLSKETSIKIIATNDTHYPYKEYAEAHEAFMCIAMNKNFDDPKRLRHSVHEFYIKTPDEMTELFLDIPEAIKNTQEIVNKCNLTLKLGNPTPPNFLFTLEYSKEYDLNLPFPNEKNSLENDKILFEHVCKIGLEERLVHIAKEKHEEYRARLESEIEIIKDMRFPGYMLIVWDFIREAKSRGVPVGPGRGSAAGSLVVYSLKITDIDPMPYNLLFERFLNPSRISMPDIDIDFCQKRREEIFDYVVQKYGRYNVAQVITFGKLLARGVIRDTARVLGMPYAEADAMAKLIPNELEITLNGKGKEGEPDYKPGAFQKEPKLRELIATNEKAKRVWKFALALEGLNRNAGMHAAGVVISNEELWGKTPLYKPSGESNIVTQYSLKFLEDVDLIKFDFLGLKTLTVIDEAIKLVKIRHNKIIEWSQIAMDDKEVYKLIRSGHTVGLFQIESDGMQQLNARLQPTTFEDIIAVLALYRPGPMESGMLDDFIERKHGRAKITYVFDALEPILKPTYGVIVYQEQVMQIVQTIGGFSLGGADLVRRAMGKKIKEEMDRLKSEFADGAVKNGYDRKKSEELFDLIVKFAGYGFNKSHSAAYAMITFQTAWLKAHYSQEFMAALLTSEQNNTDKIVQYIEELDRLRIKLLPPNMKKSMVEFAPIKTDKDENGIMFGLGAIKGVGAAAVKVMLEEREKTAFKDLSDFISRTDTQKVNKKVIESLIKSGALDCFGYSRRALLEQITIIIKASQDGSLQKKRAENSLFGTSEDVLSVNINIEKQDEYELKTILNLEKETIGFYISGHPLDEFKEQLKKIKYTLSSELDEIASGSKTTFIGKVEEIKTKISKKGNKFSILTLLDLHGNLEFTIFEKTMEKLEALGTDELLAVYAEISKDSSGTSFRVLKVMNLQEAKKQKIEIIKIDNDAKQSEIAIKENANNDNFANNDIQTFGATDEEPTAAFAQTGQIFTSLYGDNGKANTLEIIVELSNDTVILDKISELLHVYKGSQKAKLTIIYKEQKLKEIPLSFGVNDSFVNELQKMEGVRLQR
ncbi:MAG: DNA polymerase III subunit alpha [Campylobacteraceae bacterium]|jgi:DNA polymerase-3 subunit alpha|nr:DNA polymerase III subunit alpha [Campylobacteraceae bacterium]